MFNREKVSLPDKEIGGPDIRFVFKNWRGRDGNDPSVDIAKDADQRF